MEGTLCITASRGCISSQSAPGGGKGGGGEGVEALGAELLAMWFIFVEPEGLFKGGEATTLNLAGLESDTVSEAV